MSKTQRPRRWCPASSNDYLSIDRLHLSGGLSEFDLRCLEINGRPLPIPSLLKFLVLLALVSHSLTLSGVAPPMQVEPVAFLSAKSILQAIENYLNGFQPKLGPFFRSDPAAVTDAIYDIRKLLYETGIHPNLIQNGPSGRAYRLGTAPHNVQLSFRRPGTQEVLHFEGGRLC